MIEFLKTYKGFVIGFFVLLSLLLVLSYSGFILIDYSDTLTNLLLFVFWWVVISLPFHQYEYLVQNRKTVLKILLLLLLIIVTTVSDVYMNIPDNPVTVFGILIFWIATGYLLFPSFFKKYRYPILGVYLVIFNYFLFVRFRQGSFDAYVIQDQELAIGMFFMPIPFILGLWGYEQWKWLKTLKTEKAKGELALLKSQINPHFFFNTLNNLYSLTVKQSPEAPEVILKLSDMMRYTIYEGQNEQVSLKEELAYLQNYIELHKIRYHKEVAIQFDHEIEEGCQVAPLLFIILLENAFKHGAEKMEEGAFISIILRASREEIYFSVSNNYDPQEVPSSEGIGHENLKRRLALTYKQQHELNLSAKNGVFHAALKIRLR